MHLYTVNMILHNTRHCEFLFHYVFYDQLFDQCCLQYPFSCSMHYWFVTDWAVRLLCFFLSIELGDTQGQGLHDVCHDVVNVIDLSRSGIPLGVLLFTLTATIRF